MPLELHGIGGGQPQPPTCPARLHASSRATLPTLAPSGESRRLLLVRPSGVISPVRPWEQLCQLAPLSTAPVIVSEVLGLGGGRRLPLRLVRSPRPPSRHVGLLGPVAAFRARPSVVSLTTNNAAIPRHLLGVVALTVMALPHVGLLLLMAVILWLVLASTLGHRTSGSDETSWRAPRLQKFHVPEPATLVLLTPPSQLG